VEIGAGPLPEAFTFIRTSDVFPTNNTLVDRDVLARSGLFDLAFDRGARADHDLGTRIYLSGAFMVMDPDISILHHHAPQGGLRTHGARVVTYASSRARLTRRALPAVTELYLSRRYFNDRQVREALWIAVLGTFSMRGSGARRLLKAVFSALLLPDTLRTLRARMLASSRMSSEYPKIPAFRGRLAARKEA
jgi:GT2 family glycosyltransferase